MARLGSDGGWPMYFPSRWPFSPGFGRHKILPSDSLALPSADRRLLLEIQGDTMKFSTFVLVCFLGGVIGAIGPASAGDSVAAREAVVRAGQHDFDFNL